MSGIKVAVIGFGNMGTAHATCLAEGKIRGLELAAVCDIRPERLAESQKIRDTVDGQRLFSFFLDCCPY